MIEPILTLDKYRLLEVIGSGGMATVYKAMIIGPMGFEKPAAVKLLHTELGNDADVVRMFIDEAKVGAQLSHPGVISILDFGEIDNRYYMAMEFIDGCSLSALMKPGARKTGRPVPVEPSVCAIIDTLDGLTYVHSAKDDRGKPLGIVHRDISPHNILVDKYGKSKIGDFGIATGQYRSEKTSFGIVKGKAAYMSPEQAAGKPLDHRSDLAAAGLTLFALLSGKAAYSGSDTSSVMSMAESGLDRDSINKLECGDELKNVIAKATSLKISERYQSAAQFREALAAAVPDYESAGRPLLAGMVSRTLKPVTRTKRTSPAKKLTDTAASKLTGSFRSLSRTTAEGPISRKTILMYRISAGLAALSLIVALGLSLAT